MAAQEKQMESQWTFGDYILRHLKTLLALWQASVEKDGKVWGVLEWTLPLGGDDGNKRTWLTLVEAPRSWNTPRRVRVAVASVSIKYVSGRERIVDLPRYIVDKSRDYAQFKNNNVPVAITESRDPESGHAATESVDSGFVRNLAAYLVTQVNGDAESLRADANGYWSFTVVLAEPGT